MGKHQHRTIYVVSGYSNDDFGEGAATWIIAAYATRDSAEAAIKTLKANPEPGNAAGFDFEEVTLYRGLPATTEGADA